MTERGGGEQGWSPIWGDVENPNAKQENVIYKPGECDLVGLWGRTFRGQVHVTYHYLEDPTKSKGKDYIGGVVTAWSSS